MEREAVLHWLEDVQIATLGSEELDGGLLDPDNGHQSSSDPTFSHSPTEQAKPNQQLPHPGAAHYPYSVVPSSSFQVPQGPSSLIVRKRTAFKHSKSNTVSDIQQVGRSKLQGRSPSCDSPEQDHAGNLPRNPLSPLPAVNPDMVLPTITFVEGEKMRPTRKPLLKRSTFLVDPNKKTLLPSAHSQSPSKRPPTRGKSAPASPECPRNHKVSSRGSLSVLSISSKSYSQGDLRQQSACVSNSDSREHYASDGESGSCEAARGELSDVASSSDLEMPCGSYTAASSVDGEDKICVPAEGVVQKPQQHSKIEERMVMKETRKFQSASILALDHAALCSTSHQESTPSMHQLKQHRVVQRGPSPSLPILPSEIAQKIPSFLATRNLLQRSSSVQHGQSPKDSAQETSLGLGSLAFHDHHLGRGESHKMVKTSTIDSSRFQQMSAMELLAHVAESAPHGAKEKGSSLGLQNVTEEQ